MIFPAGLYLLRASYRRGKTAHAGAHDTSFSPPGAPGSGGMHVKLLAYALVADCPLPVPGTSRAERSLHASAPPAACVLPQLILDVPAERCARSCDGALLCDSGQRHVDVINTPYITFKT